MALQSHLRRSWKVVSAGVAVLVLTACGNSSGSGAASGGSSQGPSADNPVTIHVDLAPSVIYAPLYLGAEQGIFLKHGIDLKVDVVSTATQALQALQSNKAQVAATAWPSMVTAVVAGVPLKAFAIVDGKPDIPNYDQNLAIAVRPGVTATTEAGLKGLKVATQFGGGSETWCRASLRAAGLNADKDVTLVNSTAANFLSVLQSGGADAICAVEPYPSLVQAKLPGSRVLVRGGSVSESRILLDSLSSWLDKNPVVAEDILAGLLESQQYMQTHFDQAVTATSHYLPNIDATVLADSMKPIAFDGAWSDNIKTSFDDSTKVLLANGTVKQSVTTDDLLDTQLLNLIGTKYAQYLTTAPAPSASS
jgi:NitT/TauT family transport system substrate-binding protein